MTKLRECSHARLEDKKKRRSIIRFVVSRSEFRWRGLRSLTPHHLNRIRQTSGQGGSSFWGGTHEVQNSRTTNFLSFQPSSHSSWPLTHSNPDSPFMRSSNQSKLILLPSKGLLHPGLDWAEPDRVDRATQEMMCDEHSRRKVEGSEREIGRRSGVVLSCENGEFVYGD